MKFRKLFTKRIEGLWRAQCQLKEALYVSKFDTRGLLEGAKENIHRIKGHWLVLQTSQKICMKSKHIKNWELGTGPGDWRHEVHGQLGNVEVALVEELWQLWENHPHTFGTHSIRVIPVKNQTKHFCLVTRDLPRGECSGDGSLFPHTLELCQSAASCVPRALKSLCFLLHNFYLVALVQDRTL